MDQFHHTYIDKKSVKIFLVFHGTGGDENDLIPLAEELNSDNSILSLRGNASENGMNRFFERYPDGTFNQESIAIEIEKLHRFLDVWLKEHDKTYDDFIWIGYSNGANFVLSFFLRNAELVLHAVLFHPMLPFIPKEKITSPQSNLYITHGKHDHYLSKKQFEELQTVLKSTDANIIIFEHEGGHELREEEIENGKKLLNKWNGI